MSDPFIGEIRMFGGTFAPVGWNLCDGTLLPIASYDVLYNLLGTTYGGDGVNTFGVPDLRGRAPMHRGPNLVQGQPGGAEMVTITPATLAGHTHVPLCNAAAADLTAPSHNFLAANADYTPYTDTGAATPMNAAVVTIAPGGGQPHENMSPYLAVTFIIATQGIYPSQG